MRMKSAYLILAAAVAAVTCELQDNLNDVVWYPVDGEKDVYISIYGEKQKMDRGARSTPIENLKKYGLHLTDYHKSLSPKKLLKRTKRQGFFENYGPLPPLDFPYPNFHPHEHVNHFVSHDLHRESRNPEHGHDHGHGFQHNFDDLFQNDKYPFGNGQMKNKHKNINVPELFSNPPHNRPGSSSSKPNFGGNKPHKINGPDYWNEFNAPNKPDEFDRPNDLNRPNRPNLPNDSFKPGKPNKFNRPNKPNKPSRPNRPNRPNRPGTSEEFNRPNEPEEFNRPGEQEEFFRPSRPEEYNTPDEFNRPGGPNPGPSNFPFDNKTSNNFNRPNTQRPGPSGSETSNRPTFDTGPLVFPQQSGTTTNRPTTSRTTMETTTISRCERECPVTSQFNPVCGTDSVTYSNIGRLKCAQACGKSVNLSHLGNCRGRRLKVPPLLSGNPNPRNSSIFGRPIAT